MNKILKAFAVVGMIFILCPISAFSQANYDKNQVQKIMFSGLSQRLDTITMKDEQDTPLIVGLKKDEIRDTIKSCLEIVLDENPQLFYVDPAIKYTILPDSNEQGTYSVIDIKPHYIDDAYKNRETFEYRVNSIIKNYIKPDMTDAQKVLALHDYITHTSVYGYKVRYNEAFRGSTNTDTVIIGEMTDDLSLYTDTSYPLFSQNLYDRVMQSHTAYGVIMNGAGVCQSYSLAFKLLAQRAGLECITIINTTGTHQWNAVKVDDKWYFVDLMFDDPRIDPQYPIQTQHKVKHDYMLISGDTMSKEKQSHDGWKRINNEPMPDMEDKRYEEKVFGFSNVTEPMYLYNDKYYYTKIQNGEVTYHSVDFYDKKSEKTVTRTEYLAAVYFVNTSQPYPVNNADTSYIHNILGIQNIKLNDNKSEKFFIAYYDESNALVGTGNHTATIDLYGELNVTMDSIIPHTAKHARVYKVINGTVEMLDEFTIII